MKTQQPTQLQLVTFEQAELLKKQGFRWECQAHYCTNHQTGDQIEGIGSMANYNLSSFKRYRFKNFFSRPPIAHAIMFYLEKYSVHGYVTYHDSLNGWLLHALDIKSDATGYQVLGDYNLKTCDLYEQAEAALLDAVQQYVESKK